MVDPLSAIYNEGYWRVNFVTPMWQYNKQNIKRYTAKILRDLASDESFGTGTFSVDMENLPLLKYSHDDPDGMQIIVKFSKSHFSTNSKEVYAAIFLSWGNSINHPNANVTHLPYMLECGEKKVGETVKSSIKSMFDCAAMPFNFSKIQLMDFLFKFLECDTSKSTDPLTFGYKISPQANFKDKASLTFDVGDIQTIWLRVKENMETHNDDDKKSLILYSLNRQIANTFSLDVTAWALRQIVLPKAEVKSNGIVKLKSPEMINALFIVLNDITHSDY